MTVPIAYRYDTFWPRFGAVIIDTLILALPLMLLQYLVDLSGNFWLSFSVDTATNVLGWAYLVLLHGIYGQTVGKMLLKVRVLDFASERSIDISQALKRELYYIIPGIFVMVLTVLNDLGKINMKGPTSYVVWVFGFLYFVLHLADIIYCINDPKRRSLHDRLGSTVVIRDGVVA